MADFEGSGIVPDMPPSRPGWKVFVGVAIVVLAAAALLHEHQLMQFLGNLV